MTTQCQLPEEHKRGQSNVDTFNVESALVHFRLHTDVDLCDWNYKAMWHCSRGFTLAQ